MGKLVLTSIFVFAALTSSFAQTDEEACTQEAMKCQQTALAALNAEASDDDKCNAIIEGLKCAQNLPCTTDVNDRILFIKAKDYLANMSVTCDKIDQEFYPTKADACEERVQQCLIKYVDKLFALEANKLNANVRYAGCQYLSEYIDCQVDDGTCKPEDNCPSNKNNCHPGMNELKTIVEGEEKRMKVDNCVVAKTDTDTLTYEECSTALGQCATIDDNVGGDMLCMKTKEAINCTTGWNCVSAVQLRIFHLQEKKKLADKNIPCEIDGLFPAEVPAGSDDCKEGMQTCLYSYVDTLMEKDKDTTVTKDQLCQELQTYIGCQLNVTACDPSHDELRKTRDEEVARMRIGSCEVDALNFGIKEASSFLLIVLMILAMVILQ